MSRVCRFAVITLGLLLGSLAGCDRLPWDKPNLLVSDLQEAQAAARDGEWTRAQRYLERYLRSEEDPELRWNAWNMLIDGSLRSDPSGQWAVDYLETMALEYEDNADRSRDVLARLAGVHESTGRMDSAVAAWEQFCLQPGLEDAEYASVQRRMARLYISRSLLEDAEEALRICVALTDGEPTQADCLFDLASLAAVRDKNTEALELAGQVMQLPGVDAVIKARAGFILADILEQQGKNKEALAMFRDIRDDYPNELVVDYRIQALTNKK